MPVPLARVWQVAGKGCFGARLMFSPALVRDCVAAMVHAVGGAIPVTVKCRLGADDMDSYEAFAAFVATVAEGGCRHFIIHARKCVLAGFTTKDNRTIPPLRYHWVQRAALEFPHLRFSVNGGIGTMDQTERLLGLRRGDGGAVVVPAAAIGESAPPSAPLLRTPSPPPLSSSAGGGDAAGADGAVRQAPAPPATPALLPDGFPVDPHAQLDAGVREGAYDPAATSPLLGGTLLNGVMIGRAAWNDPCSFADVDRRFWGAPNPGLTRRGILLAFADYADGLLSDSGSEHAVPAEEAGMAQYKPHLVIAPLMNLFHGTPGGRAFRSTLARVVQVEKASVRAGILAAMATVPDAVLDADLTVAPAARGASGGGALGTGEDGEASCSGAAGGAGCA